VGILCGMQSANSASRTFRATFLSARPPALGGVFAFAALCLLAVASPQPYVEAKGLGAAAAARIISAPNAEPATVRISYTDSARHQAVLVTHPQAAQYLQNLEYPVTAFYAVPGEVNPLFRVSVSADMGRNLAIEDIYVVERGGKVVRVPVYPVDHLTADAKAISVAQHFARPTRTLHFTRELDAVGGGSVQEFAQYFVRLSDGTPAILQTNWLLQDKSYDAPPHVTKPEPEPTVAGTYYRLYRDGTYTFFAVCSPKG
jgi:hypothetical protein